MAQLNSVCPVSDESTNASTALCRPTGVERGLQDDNAANEALEPLPFPFLTWT